MDYDKSAGYYRPVYRLLVDAMRLIRSNIQDDPDPVPQDFDWDTVRFIDADYITRGSNLDAAWEYKRRRKAARQMMVDLTGPGDFEVFVAYRDGPTAHFQVHNGYATRRIRPKGLARAYYRRLPSPNLPPTLESYPDIP